MDVPKFQQSFAPLPSESLRMGATRHEGMKATMALQVPTKRCILAFLRFQSAVPRRVLPLQTQ